MISIIGIPKASLIGLTTSRVTSTPPMLISNSGPSSASSSTCKILVNNFYFIK